MPPSRANAVHTAVGLLPPPVSATAVHNTFAPSENVTEPAGNCPAIVAVKVTLCPNVEGLSDEVKDVVLAAADTERLPEAVLPTKLASPPYVALSACAPTGVWGVNAQLAVPATSDAVQLTVPSPIVTLPLGVPPPGVTAVTFDVTVTAVPNAVVGGGVIAVMVSARLTISFAALAVNEA